MTYAQIPVLKAYALLDTMTAEQRDGALQMLDLVSRPMTTRDLEDAMRARGVARARAHQLANTIKHLHVIAIAPVAAGE
ncbi:hypothetical protein [Qipengyuania sp. NPDC077563]|uniref:hypothetical protein n=1 Tax=Qipengyuania sp. NPDC077563 TaxID=3364497 RepID=UPI00384A5D57